MADHFICDIDNIDIVLDEKILDPFLDETREGMANGIRKTMRQMVADTKGTAPDGGGLSAPVDDGRWEDKGFPNHRTKEHGGNHGVFRDHIKWRGKNYPYGYSATWYVKSPEYRLTHLLVHGHELIRFGKPTGKRVDGHPFLHNARDKADKALVPNVIAALNRAGALGASGKGGDEE